MCRQEKKLVFRIALESGQQLVRVLVCKLKDFVTQIASDAASDGLHPANHMAPCFGLQVVSLARWPTSLAPAQPRFTHSNSRKNAERPKQHAAVAMQRPAAPARPFDEQRFATLPY